MVVDHDPQARPQGVKGGIRAHLGRVEEELLAPHQAGLVAQLDHVLEEPPEQGEPQPLADARQAGVVGQRLIEVIAQVPALGQVQTGRLDQLALRADAREEHHQLQFEEDDGVNRRPPAGGITVFDPVPHEAQVELRL
jgi:hypothetical protein